MSEKKKYIVEAGDDIQLVTLTGVRDGSAITLTGVIDTLETAEKLEEEAYERGHDTGYKKCLSEHEFDMPCSICDDYERGLNDAWDAARKINMEAVRGGYNIKTLEKVFGTSSNCAVMRKFPVKEAIQKINEYEGEIRVGDEIQFGENTIIVTEYNKETSLCSGFDRTGRTYAGIRADGVTKTGRGIDMASLLEELQE